MEKILRPNGHFTNIEGTRFERLVVIEDGFRHNNRVYCKVRCDCGNEFFVIKSSLKNKTTRSCGCIHREQLIERNKRHMLTGTKIYSLYHGIIARCYNKKSTEYGNYGGRGIKMCDEWVKSFEAFYKWAMDNGYKEGLSIERIDFNGNYEPRNCTWIEKNKQALNTRRSIFITIDGVKKPICEWIREKNTHKVKPYKYYKKYGEEFVIQKFFR